MRQDVDLTCFIHILRDFRIRVMCSVCIIELDNIIESESKGLCYLIFKANTHSFS